MPKKKNKNQQPNLKNFLNKTTDEKIASLQASKDERQINNLLREANILLTNYLTANEEEKVRKIIKQLKEIKLSEFLEFEEDELLEFDVNQDYYEILEVEESASSEEIKKSCKKLCFKWHPDKNNNSEESKKKFQEIQNAAEILLSESTRSYYDILRRLDNYSEPEPAYPSSSGQTFWDDRDGWESSYGRSGWGEEEEMQWNAWDSYESEGIEQIKIKANIIIQNIWNQLEMYPKLDINEINCELWSPFENFEEKIRSLRTEELLDDFNSKILREIEIKRKSKRSLSETRKSSIQRIEKMLKENQMGIEDINKNEYGELFSVFDHECLILANYKRHINTCLTTIRSVCIFETRLIELIKREKENLEKLKRSTIKEIKKEIFPYKLEEELEGFESSLWSKWEQVIHSSNNAYDVNEYKNKFLQFVRRKLTQKLLEKTRSKSLQEIKEALDPQGQMVIQVNELEKILPGTGVCNCFSYRTYKEHINEHLEKVPQITKFKEEMISAINSKREEKRNSRSQGKKFRKQLSKFLEKTTRGEINKLEKVEEINLLIEKASALLENHFCTEEKRQIQLIRNKLEIRKKELEQGKEEEREKDRLIFQLQATLEKVNEENKLLGREINNWEAKYKEKQQSIEQLQRVNKQSQLEYQREKTKATQLLNQLQIKTKELEKKESENINLQQQLINQQNELETLRKTNLAYEQYFQKQKTEFSKLESQLSDLQNSELKSQILQNPYPPKDGKP